MNALKNWLQGNKSYCGAIAWGLLGIAWSQGWITDEVSKAVGSVLVSFTGIAIRSAAKKLEPLAHVKLKTVITRT